MALQRDALRDLFADLRQKRGQPPAAEEQRVMGLLKNDPQMRQAFFNQIAGPVMNKMFECGMIP